MIKLLITLTAPDAEQEAQMRAYLKQRCFDLSKNGNQKACYETLETTVPLTLDAAAWRVVEYYSEGLHGADCVGDLRRVLAGEYVCIPSDESETQ